MAKPAAAKEVEVIVLEAQSASLIQKIEDNVALVPTAKLVPFFTQGDKIVKRINTLKGIVREEFISRYDQGTPSGDDGQHREFFEGDSGVRVEKHRSWPVDPDKAEKLLREKKLWEEASTLSITEGVAGLQKILRKMRKELRELGVQIVEVLDENKLAALVELQKVTPAEFDSLLIKDGDPKYVVKAIKKKK